MMGSGKTTVGRILSEALGYSFTDRLVISLSMYFHGIFMFLWEKTVRNMAPRSSGEQIHTVW
jgi:shikimate kinase